MSDLSNKVKAAIERLKALAPKDGDKYFLCYSGGKDSDCIRILAALADVPHEIHHCLTTVDAPETVQYIKSIPGVIIDKATYKDGSPKTMWNLIPKKKLPPTRLMRYCCSELKEWGGKGKLKITGVRYAESVKRRQSGGEVKIIGKEKTTQKKLDELGLNFTVTQQGGVVMSLDNDMARDQADFLHHCYRDRSVTVNPIIDWEDSDVWAFLHHYGCESNPLYQCGRNRVGCLGCPLAPKKQQQNDFRLYPKYKQAYIRAFDRMLEERRKVGYSCDTWNTGEDVMRWFAYGDIDPNQLSFFDDDEIYDIMSEME
jgi:phosphoadenosine phosphosulfate reductase